MEKFTVEELRLYNGDDDRRKLIAYQGKVYEVTDSAYWKGSLHEGEHFPGLDLTDYMDQAPHGAEVFQSSAVKQVGILVE